MFIRELIKKNKDYPKKFIYHVLVESYRTDKGPRQKVILNLGTLSLTKDKWKKLANRIEEIIKGQENIFAHDKEIEALAKHYAALLIGKQLEKQTPVEGKKHEQLEYETVDLNSVKNHRIRSIGAEHAALSVIERLGFDTILSEIGLSANQIKIAKLLIVGRMVYPASELSTYQWAQENSAIGEMLNLDIAGISHNRLYRTSDLLIRHKEEIEERLNHSERDLFSLKEKIILYDLTNTYFESSKMSQLKQRGRSKDKQKGQPLVTLGLVIDECGFPKQSYIFKGNISEPKTLKKILDKLELRSIIKPDKKTIIMDAGIATEDNLELIRSREYDYIVVSRNKPLDCLPNEGFVVIRNTQENKVEARLYRQGDEIILFCRSDLKKKKEQSMRTNFQERFEADLKCTRESLYKKGGTKKYEKVLERIGRLKQKHARVAYFYDVTVKQKQGVATDVIWRIKKGQKIDNRFSGVYYLRSSRTDLNEKEIWELYISLTDVEDSFRSMKGELGLRPNYHQKDHRIMEHLFITVLAHHAVNSIQTWLHKKDVYERWSSIRRRLSSQHRVTTEFTTRDKRKIWLRQTSEPETFHYLVAEALSITPKPLDRKKMITSS
ncbi:MAG: IS1634 family transposase [Candidatus Marinimicrobia bacterium]|nr:IS1634 family transposase [Candidatus Neomarinimicrobiota bacterium]